MRDEMGMLSRVGVVLGVLAATAGRAARSMVAAGMALALSGCGADADFAQGDLEALGEAEGPQFRRIAQDITGGWVSLVPILRNGWVAAANSNTPAVGIVDGVVTFRGALNGQNATSTVAFCLNAPTYTGFRQSDAALVTVPAALANGASGAVTFDVPLLPNIPALNQYCMSIREYGAATQPGANARALTSLEGVSFDKSVSSSTVLAQPNTVAYPFRGSDSNAHPNGNGLYGKKLANNFVRFQGATDGNELFPVLFTVPSNMRPGKPVYVPVSLCPRDSVLSQAGRIQIKTNGQVVLEGPAVAANCGVSLDGSSYSLASSAGASAISLSNGWVAHSSRAVRARDSGGVVRLEGAVKFGSSTTIGTLPVGKRPAKTVYVVSNAVFSALRAVLSINSSGVIKVISPVLSGAQPGLSLDGVSFGI